MLHLAYAVAKKAHAGQKDKGGAEYIHHPVYVASLVKGEAEKAVALLHDVVEDTAVTLEKLEELGFSLEIREAVDCITKRFGEPYEVYISRVIRNPLALSVKIADMAHNSDLSRIPSPTKKDWKRSKKYEQELRYLLSIQNAPTAY